MYVDIPGGLGVPGDRLVLNIDAMIRHDRLGAISTTLRDISYHPTLNDVFFLQIFSTNLFYLSAKPNYIFAIHLRKIKLIHILFLCKKLYSKSIFNDIKVQ